MSHILLLQCYHRRRIFEQALAPPSSLRVFKNWRQILRNIMRSEAFFTYPRSYDLIHSNGVFSLYKDKENLNECPGKVRFKQLCIT
ncbi:probable methyltransferase PMT15 [Camellia sinensis]|uniref:probable methyltransferase PMT15 n=1 Tax=Camellia sinensis TaxID=4442 RepID=UPI001035FE8E|nr:probable methyltransferase PMT15 [Camellia sinensis]